MTNRLSARPRKPQLHVTCLNKDGTANAYATKDPAVNALTITLDNTTGATFEFRQGSPVRWEDLPSGQSAVYLYFHGLFPNDALGAASLSAPGWRTDRFEDVNGYLYFVAASENGVPLAADDTLAFTLSGLCFGADSAHSGNVAVDLANVAGLDGEQSSTGFFVNVANPPAPENADLALLVGFEETRAVLTGADQSNALVLYLTNPGSKPVVPEGSSSWGAAPPEFQLSFVYGSSSGALTEAGNATNIHVNPLDLHGNDWTVTQVTETPNLYWRLVPVRDDGGHVLGTQANATVTFSITDIVTMLPPGPTLAFVSYRNVPGYNDGFFALAIVKVEPISIASFTATPPGVPYGGAPGEVTLDFEVQNASYVTITNTDYARQTWSSDLKDSATARITRDTTFTLIASNVRTGQQIAESLRVPIHPVAPIIHNFVASPSRVSGAGRFQDVTLSLNVDGATFVMITGTDYFRILDGRHHTEDVRVSVATSTTFTLVATNLATGGQDAWPVRVTVGPDPLAAKTVTGIVPVKEDGSVGALPQNAPYGVTRSKSGYLVSFPDGTFLANGAITTTILPFGSRVIAPTQTWGAGTNGNFSFDVVFREMKTVTEDIKAPTVEFGVIKKGGETLGTIRRVDISDAATSFIFSVAQASYATPPATPSVSFSAPGAVAQSAPARFEVAAPGATGMVSLWDVTDERNLVCHGHARLADGRAVISNTVPFPLGGRTLQVRYAGDDRYGPGASDKRSLAVEKPFPAYVFLDVRPNPAVSGQPITFDVTAPPDATGGIGIYDITNPNAHVGHGVGTLVGGKVRIANSQPFAPGTYTVYPWFDGDEKYQGVEGTPVTLEVR